MPCGRPGNLETGSEGLLTLRIFHAIMNQSPLPQSATSGRRPWPGRWLCALALLLIAPPVAAEETVYYSVGDDGDTLRKLTGTVVDYTGRELRLETAGGRAVSLPGDKVVRIDSPRGQEETEAEALYREGKFAEAAARFTDAVKLEARVWRRRELIAQAVWSHRNAGDIVRAGELFRLILKSDPTTYLLDALPLAWTTQEPAPDLDRAATSWLADSQEEVALMGASWLLSSNRRPDALQTLERLTRSTEKRVAALAQAQLWRTQIVTATAADVERWQAAVEQMPPTLGAGPWWIVGQALARLRQAEPAALALMKVPILYPRQRQLAAEALFAAGGQLETIGQLPEAARLYREVAERHAESRIAPAAAAAARRLEQAGR